MSNTQNQTQKRTVGAFDVRTIIGGVIGLLGLFLVLVGLVADPELEKTGGIHANLITGIAMVVVGGAFLLWAKLAPIAIPQSDVDDID